MTKTVRPPAVAGAFYPADPRKLEQQVDGFLAGAKARPLRPKVLVAPHAGYVYSGPIAGSAYKLLENCSPKPTRVVLLGPAHTVGFHGVALPAVDALRTPLGLVPVDGELEFKALQFPFVLDEAKAHEREHSLEVHLPFLQRALGDFSVLPLCVGHASADDVADLLEAVWGGPETLIVVSTDLSHYLPWDEAKRVDQETVDAILDLQVDAMEGERACGAFPLAGLLLTARRKGLEPTLLDLRNSGDTAGDKGRVVGYAAFAFEEKKEA
ncbi:MAG: AmmeMemoRadiSam system protein B [Myxococcota bacterium]